MKPVPRSRRHPEASARPGARARAFTLTCLAVVVLGASGCGRTGVPTFPERAIPPPADSPVGAVLRLQWAWNQRDPVPLDGLITDDFTYRYDHVVTDSLGNTQIVPFDWSRVRELTSFDHLAVTGVSALPPASEIHLGFGTAQVGEPDARPGMDPGWHRQVTASLSLRVVTPAALYQIGTSVTFHLVRGDSAAVPPGASAVSRGPTRWWVESIDESRPVIGVAVRPAEAQPASQMSWADLRAIYLPLAN